MDILWTGPAVKAAWDNREDLADGWQRLLNLLLGRKTRIAFTGLPGVGKTVLFDCLTGPGLRSTYQPPKTASAEEDTGTINAKRRRMALTVVPGQSASTTRMDTLEHLFDVEKPVEGVIHVVSHGYIEVRNLAARETLVASGLKSIADLRAHYLAQEIEDIKDLCHRMRRCHQDQKRRPCWLIVAVTKADLFPHEMSIVRPYYSPENTSAFSGVLDQFQRQVGEDNFSWSALPVAGHPQDFEWGDETTKSSISVEERNAYLRQFTAVIQSKCLTR
ncbi:MAG: 50S ribosome-binding GTPase [Flavobacteriales bacterium]|nr:50S ribosome-binding GTPase [Flavobacteriales bacterium]MCB9193187.1 50S ribosome-binding GTPase [Flavobacteriales bacterium]